MKKFFTPWMIATFFQTWCWHFISVVVLSFSLKAHSDVQILNEKKEKSDLHYKVSEGFFPVQEKYRVYSVKIEIEDPSLKEIKEVRVEGGDLISIEDGKIVIIFSAYKGQIEFENKEKQIKKYFLIWKPLKSGLIFDNCTSVMAKLVLDKGLGKKNDKTTDKNKILDFPLGQSCDSRPEGYFVTFSTPQEVEMIDSSNIEIAGKGERWKSFEVPAAGALGGVIARYSYSSNGSLYIFNLVAPKERTVLAEEEVSRNMDSYESRFQNIFGLGTMALSYNASTSSGTDSKYGLRYSLLSTPFFKSFRIGGIFKMAIAGGATASAIDFTDVKGHLGYYKKIGNNFQLGFFGEFMYVDFYQSSSSMRLQSSQLGFGTMMEYFMTERQRLSANLNMASFGSNVLTSHMETVLEYKYRMGQAKAPWWLGFNYEIQSFEAKNAAGAARSFNENAMTLTVAF